MLYVLNDSIWFPLYEDSDAIDRCRAAPEDIFGLHVSHLSKRKDLNEHIQSYFFRFSERIVASPEFAAYWRHMLLIDHKPSVIRLYERQLSWHFARHGYTFGGLIHWRAMIDQIMQIKDEDSMLLILRHQCMVSPKEADYIAPLLDAGLPALAIRERLADHIARRKIFVTMVTVHPLLLAMMGVPFLKKARTREMPPQRAEILRLGLGQDYAPSILHEIEIWDLPQP